MRGLKFLGNSKVAMAEYPDPTPGPGEVLVRVRTSAVCGSELGSFRSPDAQDGNGGHEAMGVVADPNGSTRFRQGMRVGVATLQGCAQCVWCLQGKPDFCDHIRVVTNTHSEYVVSSAEWLMPLPDDITDTEGVLLAGDGLGVPYGASMRSGVRAGDVTCVFGCGPVGLGMTLVQTFLGARVIAVDLQATRLELARSVGAWQTLNPRDVDDLKTAITDVTHGLGPDKCFECAGRQETLDTALDVTRPEGTIVVVGHGQQQINPQRLIARKNHRLMGNWLCHFSDFSGMVAMIRNGLRASRIVTAHYPLEQAQEAYDRFVAGLEGKVALVQEG